MKSQSHPKSNTVLFIVGPTATGKTALAIKLAKKFKGEIVSADSMQIYKGMDIGTAKPTLREQKNICHHLISCVPASKSFSVFEYRKEALKVIARIIRQGKFPIVVGGTGLYVRSLMEGIDELPARDDAFRAKLEKQAEKKGVLYLYGKLKKKNALRARAIEPTDLRRIIRALEVANCKKKIVHLQSLEDLGYQSYIFGLTKLREDLYAQINLRVDRMFRRGLFKEVKTLYKKKISPSASQAVGYKELFAVIEKKQTLVAAKELIKRNSRRLAKRQLTWFKRERGLVWIDVDKTDPFIYVAEKLNGLKPFTRQC